jgi:hypothetical protein
LIESRRLNESRRNRAGCSPSNHNPDFFVDLPARRSVLIIITALALLGSEP